MKTQIKGLILGAAGLGLSVLSSPSHAITIQETYTGTVSSGIDVAGLFGAVGADLAGKSYTSTYLFDTSLGTPTSGPNFNMLQGGPQFNASASPSLGASITINGNTINVTGAHGGSLYGRNDNPGVSGAFSQIDVLAMTDASNYLFNDIQNSNGLLPMSITTPFLYNVHSGDGLFGQLHLASGDNLVLSDSSVTLSETPLPAALPLFAGGLGVIGLLARRRKRKGAAAIAAA